MLARTKALILTTCLIVSNSVSAIGYLGLDYKYKIMPGKAKANYNLKKIFENNYNSFEIYATRRMQNNVGYNLGYEQSLKKEHTHVFSANENFLGDNQSAGDRVFTSVALNALHFDVSGYSELSPKFEAIGILGLGLMRFDIKGHTTVGNVVANLMPSHNVQIIPRVGLGLQYFLSAKFGMRFLVNWEPTNMYRVKITDEDGIRHSVRPFKQSWNVTIGIVGRF